jgi:hypothetical protein
VHRSIARGCETLLEANDDTDDSAADFAIAGAEPRNNSSAIIEERCREVDDKAPRTTITKAPPKRTTKTTAKFEYESSEGGNSFICRLDKGTFQRCQGGKRGFRHLEPGKHSFEVAAIDDAGNTDKSPAKAKFKIIGD